MNNNYIHFITSGNGSKNDKNLCGGFKGARIEEMKCTPGMSALDEVAYS